MGVELAPAITPTQFDEPEFMGSCTIDLNFLEYYNKPETERMEIPLKGVPKGKIAVQLSFKSTTSSGASPATPTPGGSKNATKTAAPSRHTSSSSSHHKRR